MVKIILHGHFRDKIGKSELNLEGSTVYEIIQNLSNKYAKQLKAPLDIGRWSARIKGVNQLEDIHQPLEEGAVVEIFPTFRTAKNTAGIVQSVVGAVMIAVGLYTGSAFTAKVGTSLMFSGLSGLLFSVPQKNTSEQASLNAMYLGATGNTVAVGTSIPFGYGKFKVSGHYISFNISSARVLLAS